MTIPSHLALTAYAGVPQPTAAAPAQGDNDGDAFRQAVVDLTQTMARGEAIARQAMTTGADPHALVTALAQTELAVETAVTVRDRVVEAYQEILRMPV
jgi:flagellar hook-basal body complex protein FliE